MKATNIIVFEGHDLVGYDAVHVDMNQLFWRTVLVRLQGRRVSYLEDEVRSFLENYLKIIHTLHFCIKAHILLHQLNAVLINTILK